MLVIFDSSCFRLYNSFKERRDLSISFTNNSEQVVKTIAESITDWSICLVSKQEFCMGAKNNEGLKNFL